MIGKMNKRITIQRLAQVPDGGGGYTEDWQDVATVWAKVEPLKSWEEYEAQKVQQKIDYKMIIRYRSDITQDMRVVYNNVLYKIIGIKNIDEDNRFLELKCQSQ